MRWLGTSSLQEWRCFGEEPGSVCSATPLWAAEGACDPPRRKEPSLHGTGCSPQPGSGVCYWACFGFAPKWEHSWMLCCSSALQGWRCCHEGAVLARMPVATGAPGLPSSPLGPFPHPSGAL